jgi:predicted O-linked N-acetylglucosamine transferase (SPINDLY family)
MVMCRDAHPQVTNLIIAKNQGLLHLDFFNLEPRIITHEYKINPSLYKVWVDLLKEVPGSVHWVMKLNEGAHNNLTQSACDHGVDPKRIIFASRPQRLEEHSSRYRLADVFIETFSYNGHTIAGDALRAGLKVAILYGGSFASRVATSLMNDVGMPKLACYNFQQYHYMALQIATDAAIQQHYKAMLLNRMDEKSWGPTPAVQANALKDLF